jgi:hypothetical protein
LHQGELDAPLNVGMRAEDQQERRAAGSALLL